MPSSVTAFQLNLGGRLGSWSKAEGGGYIWFAGPCGDSKVQVVLEQSGMLKLVGNVVRNIWFTSDFGKSRALSNFGAVCSLWLTGNLLGQMQTSGGDRSTYLKCI